LYAGGSLAAAQALVSGDDVAINLMGGQTHARRDCASGFSFVNDAVLAILHLLRAPPASLEDASSGGETRRVLFLNLDGWHSSGVEEAFFTTNRVMCISLHRCERHRPPTTHGERRTARGAQARIASATHARWRGRTRFRVYESARPPPTRYTRWCRVQEPWLICRGVLMC
jgi:acetoin utilization deacetylase AcuC-like enzyme